MRFQFRSLPPNDDIVLTRGRSGGYPGASEEIAWRVLAAELSPPEQDVEKLKTRYTIEPFGTERK